MVSHSSGNANSVSAWHLAGTESLKSMQISMQKSTGQSVPYAGTNRIRFYGLIHYLSARSPGHPNDIYLHKTGRGCCQDLANHACRAAVRKQPGNRY
jgi:hypothetical protein